MDDQFIPMLQKLRSERVNFPRIIIYCQRMEDCAILYIFFERNLGQDFTEPPKAPSLPMFRLVEMFSSCTDSDVKEEIITLFTKPFC